MLFLFNPVGSSGDVHPFVGIGRVLRQRGHEVTILTAEPHRKVVESSGIGFVPTTDAEHYHAATLNPDLWHPRLGFATVLKLLVSGIDETWTQLERLYQPGRTLLVGHPLAFAMRSFEEKTGAPAATIHLAPSSIRSSYQVPALPPGIDISRLPHWLKQAFWTIIDRTQIDPLVTPAFDPWRAARGLPPVRRVFQQWINSPRRVIGLFPEWYGARQPDWPATFVHASFPLWDDPGHSAADAGLEAFLAGGPPPVVVSPGSANRHASEFFAAASAALQRLGRRGLFLSGYPEQIPPNLPDTILYRAYAPFSDVLPRAAALVHHGGVGTMAQGFSAGIPQLVMPMAFDQPDNALRATRLGVARWLQPKHFTADRVTRALGELLEGGTAKPAAEMCRDRLRGVSGVELAAGILESVA